MSVNVCAYIRIDVKSLLLFNSPQCSHVFASELFLGTLISLCSFGNSMKQCARLKNCISDRL